MLKYHVNTLTYHSVQIYIFQNETTKPRYMLDLSAAIHLPEDFKKKLAKKGTYNRLAILLLFPLYAYLNQRSSSNCIAFLDAAHL